MGIEAEIHVKETGSIIPYCESASYPDSFLVGDDIYSWKLDADTGNARVFRMDVKAFIKDEANSTLINVMDDLRFIGAELVAEVPQGQVYSQDIDLKEDIQTQLVIKNVPPSKTS